MYFLIFIFLFLVLITTSISKKYPFITFIKILAVSTIYFYYLNSIKESIYSLLITLLCFVVIIQLICFLLKNEMQVKEEDNTLFNLAHEVKNPLAVCKGYLDMLDVNDKEKIEKYLPIIKSEMKRSLTIMDEFLDLKRIKLEKDLMDFSLLIDDIKETTSVVLKENKVNVKTKNISKEAIIEGDYDKLKQVLMNLIKNSYEAEAKNIKLDVQVKNNFLRVKVIDDGKGISKRDLKKVGNVFYTTKVTGTGIGVSLSKEIIRLHGGSLVYQSSLNKGTTATIIIPIKYIF